MLGERLTNLLSLLAQDEYKTADVLAAKMNLSTKTLRNLIKELNDRLEDNGARIILKRGQGYMLEVTDLDAFQMLFISHGQSQRPPADSTERVRFIIEQFLKSDDYIKIEEICEAVFVSRKTLTTDIKKAEEFFEKFHLKIERKPHYGMKLLGDEFQIRHCLAGYLQMKHEKSAGYEVMIDPYERKIADCLLDALENEEYHISDVGLNSLVLHIIVSIQRVQAGQYISIREEDYSHFIGQEDYRLAHKCAEYIGSQLDIVFPEEEIRYLAIHIAGKESNLNLVISSDIQEAVNEMLQEIYEVFRIDLREDLELIMSLGRHLVPLVIRMKYGMRLTNPLLAEVKRCYSLAYTMAIQACAVLERRYHSILDSNEISYIALDMALSLEGHRKQIDKKKVLFVCASGAATARLMAYKMQESFRDYIGEITICDQRGIGRQDFSRIDYVFTTVPIREKVPVPICEVRELLENSDFSGVRRFLHSDYEQAVMEYYPRELFFTDIEGNTKEEVLKALVDRIQTVRELPQGFYKAVLKRENLARTCMGNRVAMPHPCRVMTEDTFVSVAILKNPVKWDDIHSIQVVFLVSVSKQKNKKIQNFYSATARVLLNHESIEKLIKERNYQTLARLLTLAEVERSE